MVAETKIAPTQPAQTVTPFLAFLLALGCSFIVANLYYAQPLTGLIGAAFGLQPAETGLLVTLTQIGYGFGLLFVVPLGDVIENRRLVIAGVGCAALALLAMSMAGEVGFFLGGTLALGVACTSVQVLLPYAAHLTSEANRGRVIGVMTSGLMLGIALARPAASLITYHFGWRLVFALSAGLMVLVAVILRVGMPPRAPRAALRYGEILRSMPPLLRDIPILRRRAAYHAALYASFSLFWTAVPLLLAGAGFGLSQQSIGLFALAGAGGIVIAPIAGWIADRGLTRPGTGCALLAMLSAFAIALVGGETGSITLLVLAAVLIDAGLVINFVLSQRSIYGPRPESRSRIGGVFTAIFFLGGAAGSALATLSLARGGWVLTTGIGMGLAALALVAFAGEFAATRASRVG